MSSRLEAKGNSGQMLALIPLESIFFLATGPHWIDPGHRSKEPL